jgi:hypothetical protein
MSPVVGVGIDGGGGAVGDEPVVTPVGEQLGLGADDAGAAHHETVLVAVGAVGDLGITADRVVDRLPVAVVDAGDRRADRSDLADRDRVADIVVPAGPVRSSV